MSAISSTLLPALLLLASTSAAAWGVSITTTTLTPRLSAFLRSSISLLSGSAFSLIGLFLYRLILDAEAFRITSLQSSPFTFVCVLPNPVVQAALILLPLVLTVVASRRRAA